MVINAEGVCKSVTKSRQVQSATVKRLYRSDCMEEKKKKEQRHTWRRFEKHLQYDSVDLEQACDNVNTVDLMFR